MAACISALSRDSQLIWNRGILAALAAAVLFGLSTPLAKALTGSVSPLLLSGLLYAGSGLGLALLLCSRRLLGFKAALTWPRGRDIGWLAGAVLTGGAIAPFLLMTGLRQTDAATASLALNLESVFTALIAWFVFRENFDRRIAIGMLLIVAGGATLSTGAASQSGALWGDIALAGACLAWAVDNNLTRKISACDAMLIACVKGLVAGSCSIAIALALGQPIPPGGTLRLAAHSSANFASMTSLRTNAPVSNGVMMKIVMARIISKPVRSPSSL